MLELILGIALAASATYFVLLPILRPPLESAGALSGDQGEDPGDDMSPRAVALRALKEIEFDRATGKLSDSDYDQLKAKYTAEALAALRGESGFRSREIGIAQTPGSRIPTLQCPEHGTRPEKDALFCSDCGRRLGTAQGYCARC